MYIRGFLYVGLPVSVCITDTFIMYAYIITHLHTNPFMYIYIIDIFILMEKCTLLHPCVYIITHREDFGSNLNIRKILNT